LNGVEELDSFGVGNGDTKPGDTDLEADDYQGFPPDLLRAFVRDTQSVKEL
jgi:hypothetical protein